MAIARRAASVIGQAISAGMAVYFFFFAPTALTESKPLTSNQIGRSSAKCCDWLPSLVKTSSASLLVIVTNNLLKRVSGDTGQRCTPSSTGSMQLSLPQTGIVQGMRRRWSGFNFTA
ncbi:MAG: hypothetical protein R3D55_17210 [Chloroflexota bacterium]